MAASPSAPAATATPLPVDARAHAALHELLYSADAFAAVVFPVAVTMVLSAVAVVFINDGVNGQSSGSGVPYLVYDETNGDSQSQLFTAGLINALAIVGGIIVMTFLIVVLFYFNMTRTFMVIILLQLALLLAFSTGLMVQIALALLNVPTDALTYSLVFYNFAIGGIVSIFYPVAVHEVFTQAYLVIISVTMAWIWTRYFPDYTLWILLAVIALYDLCAVLTPCGPLNLLVGIMQDRNVIPPGMLYEARIQRDGPTAPQQQQPQPPLPRHPQLPTRRPPPAPALRSPHVEEVESRPDTSPSISIRSSSTSRLIDNDEEMRNVPMAEVAIMAGGAPPPPTSSTRDVSGEDDYDVVSTTSAEMAELMDKSIRIGLGDFIFYSIIGAKAALNSFTCFIAVFVVVLLGLGMTLVLLAAFRRALPALPFSIFFGLIFYFLTDLLIVSRVQGSAWVFE